MVISCFSVKPLQNLTKFYPEGFFILINRLPLKIETPKIERKWSKRKTLKKKTEVKETLKNGHSAVAILVSPWNIIKLQNCPWISFIDR